MDRDKIIDFYRQNGMGVFRLIGKKPMMREWQKVTSDNLEAYNHHGNLGANVPQDIVVIDIDPRNFPKREDGTVRNTGIELFNALGINKPDTLKVVTGSGGLHLYFRKPPEIHCKKNLEKDGYPGIDIKTMNGTKGGYVVIPPSIHPETNAMYCFKDDETTSIMDIPENLLSLIKKEQAQIMEEKQDEEAAKSSAGAKVLYVEWLMKHAPLAIQGANGDNTTFVVACKGKDLGLDKQNTYFCMLEYWNDRCSPAWEEAELYSKVTNAYMYGTKNVGSDNPANKLQEVDAPEVVTINWDFQGDGTTLKKTLYNTVNFFRLPAAGLRGLLTYNEFTQRVEFTSKPPWQTDFFRRGWADEDIVACKYHLSSRFGFEVNAERIDEAAKVAAMENRKHPVKEYLESLEWDGVSRINTWLWKYGKTENNAYTREVGRKMLVGAVARIYRPGCKFDYVPILEGKQGIRKSTLCSVLGGPWYAEVSIDPRSKEIVHAITGKWFVELSEMETSRKADADALKAFITMQNDRLRLPYARHSIDVPRQSIFIGTINPQQGLGYLKDQTGNRRFWPIEVKDTIATEELKEVRDQLFAEAVHLYKSGESLYIDKADVEQMAMIESDKRSGGDPWAPVIQDMLNANPGIQHLRPVDIYVKALNGRSIDFGVREKLRIQKAMKSLGYRVITEEHPETKIRAEVFTNKKPF